MQLQRLIKSDGLPLSRGAKLRAFAFLCKNPAVLVPKILGFLLWLSAKKLKMQFVPRARSARQILSIWSLNLCVDYYIVDVIKLVDVIKKENIDNYVCTDVMFRNGGGSGEQCAGIYS